MRHVYRVAAIVALLAGALFVRGQSPNTNTFILRIQNAGSNIKTAVSYVVLNFTSPLQASASGSTITLSCPTCGGGGGGSTPRSLDGSGGRLVACYFDPVTRQDSFTLFVSLGNDGTAATAACDTTYWLEGYVTFPADGSTYTATKSFDLPSDWSGVLKTGLGARSSDTTAPTVTIELACISTGATTLPITYGTAQTVSLTPLSSSGRTFVSTTLLTTVTYANKACTANDLVFARLSVTSSAAAGLDVLTWRFTE